MLLETAQNNLIALVDHRPAQPRDAARAGVMTLLCQGRRSDQRKQQNEKESGHLIAAFDRAFGAIKFRRGNDVNPR